MTFYTKIRDHLKYWGFSHILHFFKPSPRLLCDFASIFCQSHYFCCQLQSHPFPPAERPSQHTTNLKVCPILTFRSKYFSIEVWIIKRNCAQHFYEEQNWLNNNTWNHGSLMIVHSLLYLSSFSLVMIISRTVFCP